jgi:enoyl-CoA hydratase/carnithine racemase
MTEHIKIEKSDGILSLTMARPDKKNALTNAMYGALADAIEGAETDPSVRVLLIRGEGDMFTAGNDVGEFAAIATGAVQGERHVSRFFRRSQNRAVRWSQPYRDAPSVSAPPCCCIAIWSCWRRTRCFQRPSLAWRWFRKRPPAC